MTVAGFVDGAVSCPQATEEPNWAYRSPADGRCPEAEQESEGTHVRKAKGQNWYSPCQTQGQCTPHICD